MNTSTGDTPRQDLSFTTLRTMFKLTFSKLTSKLAIDLHTLGFSVHYRAISEPTVDTLQFEQEFMVSQSLALVKK